MLNLIAGGLPSGATTTAAVGMEEEGRDSPSGGGVVTGGHLPALREVENTSGSDHTSDDVGSREFGSLKPMRPNVKITVITTTSNPNHTEGWQMPTGNDSIS